MNGHLDLFQLDPAPEPVDDRSFRTGDRKSMDLSDFPAGGMTGGKVQLRSLPASVAPF